MTVQHRTVTALAVAMTVAGLTMAACSSGTAVPQDSTLAVGSTTTVAEATTTVADTTPSTTALATTTVAKTTTTVAATSPPTTSAPLYVPVSGPAVPTTHTDPFVAAGTLANGSYWTIYNGGDATKPAVTVLQAFFGDECISKAAELNDECLNDIYVVGDPSRDIADMPFASNVIVTVTDPNTMQSYRITPAELVQIRGGSATASTPAGFGFVTFPWLMTVANGKITRFEQVWTP